MNTYTAVIHRTENWWVGQLQELPNVILRVQTREELIENLHSALLDILEIQREEVLAHAGEPYEEVSITA